jgi:hypothetical protein
LDPNAPWSLPAVVDWSQLLLNSYRHWIGRELIGRAADIAEEAQALFVAPLVVVSHGMETDPILNYGNLIALDLWQLPWDEFITTPSRHTAELVNRAEREWMLEQARSQGHIMNYRGVRISKAGRRFLVENAVVWNVIDTTGRRLGQAASFSHWRFL